MKSFSPRSLKYMRAFAAAWPDSEVVQRTVAQVTWRHNLTLLEKLTTAEDRLWYAAKTVEHGWSRKEGRDRKVGAGETAAIRPEPPANGIRMDDSSRLIAAAQVLIVAVSCVPLCA